MEREMLPFALQDNFRSISLLWCNAGEVGVTHWFGLRLARELVIFVVWSMGRLGEIGTFV